MLALPQMNQSWVVGRVQRELPLQLVVQVAAFLGLGRLGGLAPVVVGTRRRCRPRSTANPVRVVGVIVVGGRRRDVGHGPGQRLLQLVVAARLLQRQANGLALDLSTGRALPLRMFHQSLGDGLDGLQTTLGVTELAFVAVRALFAVRTRLRADSGQTDARRFAPEEHVQGRTRTAQWIVRRHEPARQQTMTVIVYYVCQKDFDRQETSRRCYLLRIPVVDEGVH